MGKTRDLFKKIRDTQGTFHAKMGTKKDRNGMDLREAEDIKKMQQECTEELYKKDLHDPDNHHGVLLAKLCQPLTCFILYSKAKLVCTSKQLFISYFCILVPYDEKDILWVCVWVWLCVCVLVLEEQQGEIRKPS